MSTYTYVDLHLHLNLFPTISQAKSVQELGHEGHLYIFGAWGPKQGGAAAPGGGANLAKCPFFGKTSRENPNSEKRSKKEGSKTMLEMIAAKF